VFRAYGDKLRRPEQSPMAPNDIKLSSTDFSQSQRRDIIIHPQMGTLDAVIASGMGS
jgi:hypothetical protein